MNSFYKKIIILCAFSLHGLAADVKEDYTRLVEEDFFCDDARIDKHEKTITQMLWRNKCQRIGLIVGASALAAVGTYTFLAGHEQNKVTLDSAQTTEKLAQIASATANNNILIAELAQKAGITLSTVAQKPSSVGYTHAFLKWLKATSTSARDHLAVGALVAFIAGPFSGAWHWSEHMLQRLYHSADLAWFMSKKTYVTQYFLELIQCSQDLALLVDDKEYAYKEASVAQAATVLVQEIEKIIAFMEYQSKKIYATYPRYAIQMQAATKAVKRITNTHMKTILASIRNKDKAQLEALVVGLRDALRKEQSTFCVYESAALFCISDTIE